MEPKRSLGEILREARGAKGVSLRAIAGQMDITPSYLSDIENDRRVPAEDVLSRLAGLLSLDADDLMAQAGRFGEQAEKFARQRPVAVKLFRRLASVSPPDNAMQKMIDEIERQGRDGQDKSEK